jgi:hypothetical protein
MPTQSHPTTAPQKDPGLFRFVIQSGTFIRYRLCPAGNVHFHSVFGTRELSTSRTHKALNQCGDLICGRVQCEMTSVENVNLGFRYVLAVSLRLAGIE